MQEQKRVTGIKKFLCWVPSFNKSVELYLELALYYLLSSWWAAEQSSGYLHVFRSGLCSLCWYHDDTACGTWNSSFKYSLHMVSMSFGLCRHTARYNYEFSKSKAKHYVRAAFLSLPQSLLQLNLKPVGFNLFVFKTHLQGRQAALSVSCQWDVRTHSKAARITWDFTIPPGWGQPWRVPGELMGCVAPHPSAQGWVSALHHFRVAQAILTCTQSGQRARAFCALQPGLGGDHCGVALCWNTRYMGVHSRSL